MPQRGAITYEGRPLSRGGVHKLRTRGFVAGYRALQYFAEAVSLDVRPTSLRIEMLEGEGVPKEISLSLRAELDNRYITTRVRTIGAYRGHQWDTDPGLLAQIVKRLADGTSVVLFAEGTSSDGNRVLPFRSALLGAVEEVASRGDAGSVLIQPMAITYTGQHGIPMGRQRRPLVAWYGDLDFMPHIKAFIERGAVDAVVSFGEPVAVSSATDRKAVTRQLETAVRRLLATTLRGRPLVPQAAE